MSSPETPAAPEAANPNSDSTAQDSATVNETARLSAELAQAQERLLRLAADFDNYKKRAARERDDARKNGTESVLGKLLPVLDNFDMAMAAAAQPNTTLESLKVGVTMIHGQFRALLSDLGVTALDATGQPFDPSLHEAVSTVPAGEVPDGHVAQQVRRGYRFGDRLLRPASVVVASKSV